MPRLVAAGLAAGLAFLAWPGGLDQALAGEVERHHRRAFSQATPCEFASSDPQAVGAWLARAVGYEVAVPQLAGAELLGARRCQLAGVLTASLLYRKDGQALTLFLPRSTTPAAAAAAQFADGEHRCGAGPQGGRICVGGDGARPVMAVAEREEHALQGVTLP